MGTESRRSTKESKSKRLMYISIDNVVLSWRGVVALILETLTMYMFFTESLSIGY